MYHFQGISAKAMELLALNSFHDSKAFYEEHKEELKVLATVPMRKLMTDLSETLLELDENIYVNPVYSVSRIRRDTRFSKNKMMYRENMWLKLQRHKNLYHNIPMMWFEFRPQHYSYGLFFSPEKPSYMEVFRELLLEQPDRFRSALTELEKVDISFHGEPYKKKKDGNPPEDLERFYNSKYLEFSRYNSDLTPIRNERFVDEMKNMICGCTQMYKFLMEVHDRIVERGLCTYE